MWSLLFGGVAAILGPIAKIFTSANVVTGEEFMALSAAEQAEYVAYAQAVSTIQQTKVVANSWWGAKLMIYLFGVPAALHWAAVFLDSTFKFHWGIPSLPGGYAGAELQIALSFFIIAPAMPVIASFTQLLMRLAK